MPRKQTNTSARTVDPSETYIRESIAELEGAADREALLLLCTVGIFAMDDPAKLAEAVGRLRGQDERQENDRVIEAQEAIAHAVTSEDARRLATNALEDLHYRTLNDSIEAAYLLGMAVGRRIGPQSLKPLKGGAR
jgi:hypothetical protein